MIIINNSRNDYSYAIHMSAGLTHWIPSGRKGMNGQSQGGEHQNGGGGGGRVSRGEVRMERSNIKRLSIRGAITGERMKGQRYSRQIWSTLSNSNSCNSKFC